MKTNIFISLIFLSFIGCSKKEMTPIQKKVEIKKVNSEQADIKKVKEQMIEEEMVEEQINVATNEFVPEHIRRSSIEVVKHY
ncbi:MAG: Unknown protein [uncultured Sulfurovum sp.]|uniref:Uncharacterized protein n=1 Tax=uncultured Sulfurovum sp. TaxID=269237 RepID=A0A6S6TQ80_9BACT|nr:MAG: Unknown protein [uncultured Sulfurovum sp.]